MFCASYVKLLDQFGQHDIEHDKDSRDWGTETHSAAVMLSFGSGHVRVAFLLCSGLSKGVVGRAEMLRQGILRSEGAQINRDEGYPVTRLIS